MVHLLLLQPPRVHFMADCGPPVKGWATPALVGRKVKGEQVAEVLQ